MFRSPQDLILTSWSCLMSGDQDNFRPHTLPFVTSTFNATDKLWQTAALLLALQASMRAYVMQMADVTSCARGDTLCPRPSPPRGRQSASRAAEQTQRSSTFPRRIRSHADRCSRLTLSKAAGWPWPSTFWPWKWRPSHVWLWATSVPILVFLGLYVLELYARCTRQTDVRETDRRQIKASLNAPTY